MYEHVDVFFDPNYLQNFVHKIDIEMVVLYGEIVSKNVKRKQGKFTQYVFVYEFSDFLNVQKLFHNEQRDTQMVFHRYVHVYD
jgi:hypothetical protein